MPRSPLKRPWWKWNLVTLAVVLFVLMWVRELTGMGPGFSISVVLGVCLLWWIAPAALAGELPPPLPSTVQRPRRRVDPAMPRPRHGRLCRVWAVVMLVVALVWGGASVLVILMRMAYVGWFNWLDFGLCLWPLMLQLAAAVALWTLGDLSDVAHRLLDRQPPPVRVRRKVSSSRTIGKVDPYD